MELKPRIKPKAPATLKQNVLEAVRREENSLPQTLRKDESHSRRRNLPVAWLSAAAAVLTVGIMTFTFLPRTNTENRTNTDLVASVSSTPQPSSHKEGTRKQRSQAPTCSPVLAQTAIVSSTEKPSLSGVQRVQKVQKIQCPSDVQRVTSLAILVHHTSRDSTASVDDLRFNALREFKRAQIAATPTENLIAATPTEERLSTPLPHREGQGGESLFEQQLLANFEKHRDLVNACLAEELAQTRMTQNYLRQIQRQSLQDYLDLQQNIQQQVREAIDELRQEPNVPQTV